MVIEAECRFSIPYEIELHGGEEVIFVYRIPYDLARRDPDTTLENADEPTDLEGEVVRTPLTSLRLGEVLLDVVSPPRFEVGSVSEIESAPWGVGDRTR